MMMSPHSVHMLMYLCVCHVVVPLEGRGETGIVQGAHISLLLASQPCTCTRTCTCSVFMLAETLCHLENYRRQSSSSIEDYFVF